MSNLESNDDFTPDCVRNDSAAKRIAAKTLRLLLAPVLKFLNRRCEMCGALMCGECSVELLHHPSMQIVCDGCVDKVEYSDDWAASVAAITPDWLREDAEESGRVTYR